MLVGLALNWFLLGVLTMQIYVYYVGFPTDRIFLKAIVYTIYILESAQTFLISEAAFKYIPGVIILLSLLQLGGAIETGLRAKRARLNFGQIFSNYTAFITTIVDLEGGSVACDIMIAASMTYYVRTFTYPFHSTLAIVITVLVSLPRHNIYWIPCALVVGKAYSNSMMVALNSRMKVGPHASSPAWNEERTPSRSAIHDIIFASRSQCTSNDAEHS
ncbi:hypothetical protein BDZ97DRAFT_1791322 [Flammula alnicola]|nr:hypothetical protein BDZ97DRAFT_1791322 [Flammula alnicola]